MTREERQEATITAMTTKTILNPYTAEGHTDFIGALISLISKTKKKYFFYYSSYKNNSEVNFFLFVCFLLFLMSY